MEASMNRNNITTALSSRYQRLASEVVDRLPSGWHADRIVRLEESRETLQLAQGRPAIACTARLQFKSDEMWIVTLYTASLDTLSDEAVRWILARELGRVLSEPNHSWRRKAKVTPAQDARAEALALGWGFSTERRRFEEEYLLPRAS
jgi:hypothetical protein